ncbi:MAG: RsmE family RNA methyltransferase [Deltaproteobacteria bacterium]|nr:RsmE family RNA methyltransferase [Deltaproteobacteria bacterium]
MHNRFYVNDLSNKLIGKEINLPLILNHVKALRLNNGSEIKLYDGSGILCTGIISSISKKNITVKILSFEKFTEKPVRIHLFLPIIASNLMDIMLSKICELDIYSVYPLITSRCIRHLDISDSKGKIDRWKKISASSMILSGRNKMTKISQPVDFKEAFSLCGKFDIKFIGDLSTNELLKDYLLNHLSLNNLNSNEFQNNYFNIALFIGPEGDFSDEELKLAEEQSFIPIKLADYVMSSFSAAIFSASVLVCFFM